MSLFTRKIVASCVTKAALAHFCGSIHSHHGEFIEFKREGKKTDFRIFQTENGTNSEIKALFSFLLKFTTSLWHWIHLTYNNSTLCPDSHLQPSFELELSEFQQTFLSETIESDKIRPCVSLCVSVLLYCSICLGCSCLSFLYCKPHCLSVY